MQRRISFEQYRTMDLSMFTAVLCVCEAVIVLAATRWFSGEMYTLSLTSAVTALVMVRWGAWATIPAVLGALSFCIASGASAAQGLIYCAGNLAALALLPALRRITWKRLEDNVLLALLYGLLAALLMQAGRAAIALLMGNPIGVCIGFITTDVLSTLFSVLIVWICRRLDGMLENQAHYVLRIQKEQEDKNNSGGMSA